MKDYETFESISKVYGIDLEKSLEAHHLIEFDQEFTRKLFGYNSYKDYYRDISWYISHN